MDPTWSELLQFLTPSERAELEDLVAKTTPVWAPLEGPQTLAYNNEADIIGYGGAAGGGKTDLACGKALTKHQKVMILRRVGTELTGIEDRLEELIGDRKGYNSQKKIWRVDLEKMAQTSALVNPERKRLQIEFASLPNPGDERGYQGRPHDLLVFDEAANFLETQVRFLLGWLRSVDPKQKCQALFCFNPPTNAEGRWIIPFFGPWLDKKHPNPAQPGELRCFATINGVDVEVPDKKPFVLGDAPDNTPPADIPRVYDFDPKDYTGVNVTKIIKPLSRTFIPSRISDNPYLFGTGYMNTLQSLPEPLRSQMLNGDFHAGMEDDAWQLIPTEWVERAQARWKDYYPKPPMDSMGVDVARGGKDKTIIACRHGAWIDKLKVFPGASTPDGHSIATHVLLAKTDDAVQHIDVIGVGASPYDLLNVGNNQVVGVDVRHASGASDRSGMLSFFNLRSELGWKLREWLDPANNTGAMLPPGPEILADLTAPKWVPQGKVIKVESREDIIKRLHRSPDIFSAICLALIDTPKLITNSKGRLVLGGIELSTHSKALDDYNPYSNL